MLRTGGLYWGERGMTMRLHDTFALLGRGLRAALLAGCLALASALGAAAADKPAPAPAPGPPGAAQTPDADAISLAAAYQGGYFEVVSAACYQLYSSMGIIATDLSQGHINGETAVNALDQNALLLGACSTSLDDVRSKTPQDDAQGQQILARLDGLLHALGELHAALEDAATTPTQDRKALDAASAAVNAARQKVETALDEYAKPL
jgi:hypothetical protein